MAAERLINSTKTFACNQSLVLKAKLLNITKMPTLRERKNPNPSKGTKVCASSLLIRFNESLINVFS